MKTIKNILIGGFVALCLASCDNNKVLEYKTVINENGEIYQEVAIQLDSIPKLKRGDTLTSIAGLKVDSLWKISSKHSDEPTEYKDFSCDNLVALSNEADWDSICYFKRDYADISDYQQNSIQAQQFPHVKVEMKFNKKFKWFYTSYEYGETYSLDTTFVQVPIDKYFTEAESRFWFTGNLDLLVGLNGIEIQKLTDKISDKANVWLADNYIAGVFKVMLSEWDEIKNTVSINKNTLSQEKDSLLLKVKNNPQGEWWTTDVGAYLDKKYNSKSFSKFMDENKEIDKFNEFFSAYYLVDFIDDKLKCDLQIPGKIIKSSNVFQTSDNQVNYRISHYRMLKEPYKINVTSYKLNVWISLFTLLIVAAAFAFLLSRKKR